MGRVSGGGNLGRKKDVKLGDIAEKLGVSVVTVSNALKGKKGVSGELRAQVLEIAKTMGYQIRQEEEKREVSVYRIGVVIAERYVKEFPSFYMDVYKYTAQETTRRGSLTLLDIVDEKRERECRDTEVFFDMDVSGVVVIGQLKKEFLAEMKEKLSVPLVCVDYYDVDEDMDYIVTDGYGGMERVVRMLTDRGYRSFCFVGTPQATRNIMDRYMGYCKGLEIGGLQDQQQNLLYDRSCKGYDYHLNVEVPEKLPEVFVCNCDKIAKILVEKLMQRGIRVPEDVGVTGFDNFYARINDSLSLTTYENDGKAIAQISVNTLFRRISGKSPSGIRLVEGRLVEGNTIREKIGEA